MMVSALKYLPLADAIAIAFVMPFILLLMGRFILHEQVGRRRLIAAIVGFVGTLLVVQPSFAQVGWAALLPLGVALNFALFMLITRQIARETDPIGLQAVSGVVASLLLLPTLLPGHAVRYRIAQLCRAGRVRAQPALWHRHHRYAGASADDLVAALCAGGDPRTDAVSRNPGRRGARLADLRVTGRAALRSGASRSPLPPGCSSF